MQINFENETPIFMQIAEQIEDGILSGAFPEETQVPSTTEISITYKINPATALKGINLLVDEGAIYKKRGVGMFVTANAVKMLQDKRKKTFYERYVASLLSEAKRLNVSQEEIISMIKGGI